MIIKARVIAADDKEIASGALAMTARNIPVTVGFDGNKIVGRATVFADGTAELEIDAPLEQKPGDDNSGVLGLGFVVEKERHEGDVRIIEKLRPVTVGISAELFGRLLKGGTR
jgi:hypothetical protein